MEDKENGPRADNGDDRKDVVVTDEKLRKRKATNRKDEDHGPKDESRRRHRSSSSSSRSPSPRRHCRRRSSSPYSRSRSRSPARRGNGRSYYRRSSSYDCYGDGRRYSDRDEYYHKEDDNREQRRRDYRYDENHSSGRRPESRSRGRSQARWEPPPSRDHSDRHHKGSNNIQSHHPCQKFSKTYPDYHVVVAPKDERLGDITDDPRGADPTKRITQKAASRGTGRNTESFDPASTLVRPDLRIQVGSSRLPTMNTTLKHDDVVIVPELFGAQDDWTLYYKLVKEMSEVQAKGDVKGSEWISWHEGAHLICKNPTGSPTFAKVIDRLCEYFSIKKESIGTRFNWYRDSSDWKPFHHDSAAFNPQRARNQNITVGVSFGATRELAFIRAEPLQNEEKVRLYFPQTNNGVFSFGRDANILWKHGVNALPPAEQDGKGRISIILWGLTQNVIEEDGSPPLLGSDGQGPHANHNNNNRNGNGNGRNDSNNSKKHRGRNNRRGSRGGRGRGGGGDGRNNDKEKDGET